MYKIKMIIGSTETLIYNDITPELTTTKLVSPSLSLKDNTAGSLTFTMPQGNAGYSSITPIKTYIKVYRDNVWIWTGRVLSIEKDFWLQKKITCEGALAFLNDSIAPLHKYSNYPIASFVSAMLDIHNSKTSAEIKKIYRGSISTSTASGSPVGNKDYVVEDDKVLVYLMNLADDWGFHIRLRESSNKLYLDMLTDTQLNMATQSIDFGSNLLDYSDNYDWSDIITVLHPIGASKDTNTTTGDEDFPDHVVITGTPSVSGFSRSGEFLINNSAVNTYGRIEATVTWSEADDAATLLSLAELYLQDYQYNDMKLTVKVVDLHYMTSSTAAFNFLDQINCYSRPHNMNTTFIATEMTIPFDQPEQTTFSFSRSTKGYYGSDRQTASVSSGKISATSADIAAKTGLILKTARANATEMINMATNGFVTMVPTAQGDRTSAIVISNNVDMNSATRKWTWNVNGLMHQSRSSASASWSSANVAITMDGAIVANAITTGVLTVADSNNGVLFSADMTNNTVHIANFTVVRNALYTGSKTSIFSTNVGTYMGTDGFSTTVSGGYTTALQSGVLSSRMGYNSSRDFGRIGFTNGGSDAYSDLRIETRGRLLLMHKSGLAVSSDAFGSAPTVYEGITKTVAFTVSNTSHYLYFRDGLLYDYVRQ